jgi:CheY-like chemotaxis protein
VELPRRIVVCEADELVRGAISKVARTLKFEVVEAVTGPQALSALIVADAALGFVDLHLPDLSGLEVARRLRIARLHTPPRLVAVSGWMSPREYVLFESLGFAFHLPRPIDPERVVDILGTVG